MDADELAAELRATRLILLALVTELQKVAPHTLDLMNSYMVELLSRPGVDRIDRDAVPIAREYLAGIGEGFTS